MFKLLRVGGTSAKQPRAIAFIRCWAALSFAILAIGTFGASATAGVVVTPVCHDPAGCVAFVPGAPTSTDKIRVKITTGIPPSAVIPKLSVSVSGNLIKIDGAYFSCQCNTFGLPTQPYIVVLEPLAPGHYDVQFTTVADPSFGNDWVFGPEGFVEGSILIPAEINVSPSPFALPNYQGLWWASPAGSESGWGLNLTHQGDLIFASWFTYDLSGKAWWLVATASKTVDGAYSGALYQVSGPPFDSMPFPAIGNNGGATGEVVGTVTLTFSDTNNGTFGYSVRGVSQTKAITREVFGPQPYCTFGIETDLSAAQNYQDLWWAAPTGSEAGWGINLAHQGDTIFGTWFTYDRDRTPMWLAVMAPKSGLATFTGNLYRTVGPAFDSAPFPPIGTPGGTTGSIVGAAMFAFSDGNNGTFAYTLDGVTQTKAITRQVFVAPGTVCQ